MAPVELLVLRYDLRRERELVDERRLGKSSEALAKRGEEWLVAMLACSFCERREPLSGDARGIDAERVLVVGAVPATPHVEPRSAEKAAEERTRPRRATLPPGRLRAIQEREEKRVTGAGQLQYS